MLPTTERERERATILAVDDTPANLSLLNALLKDHYRVKLANHGAKACLLYTSRCV